MKSSVRIILFDDDNDDQSTRATEPLAVSELLHYNDRSNVASEPRRGRESEGRRSDELAAVRH